MKSMNLFRQIVSGPKNRYTEDGYNLDLTYITKRIIAMAYPAEGVEKLYRNSIDSVAEFLNKNHKNNYQIINVSGRSINAEILSNIKSFYWEDHKTPQFHVLFSICEIMLEHLLMSPDKICVVHCNHGKGRTGTLICCFLLYVGYFETPDEAMKFYARKRFLTEGYGVTQPCQIQYIRYFNELLKKPKIYPNIVSISKIQLLGDHDLKDPYFKLRYVKDSHYAFNTKDEKCNMLEILKEDCQIFRIRDSPSFYGDVVLEIKHRPLIGKKLATNFAFNTTFIEDHAKMIEVHTKQFSPLSSMKSGIFEPNFKMRIHIKRLCECANAQPLFKRCEKCSSRLKGKEIDEWEKIYQILDRKPKVHPTEILYGRTIPEGDEKERTKTY